MDRQSEIEALGYTVNVMWECELRRELQESPETKDFFDTVAIHDPLEPREGFFGGMFYIFSVFF